jgi:hypothetical protein
MEKSVAGFLFGIEFPEGRQCITRGRVPVQRETAYVSRRSRRSLYQVSAIN